MNKRFTKLTGILLALVLVIGLMPMNMAKAAQKETITILETSDIHGFLMNHDYATDTPADKGLVQCATVIKEQRAIDPDLIYVDNGDITQGNMVSEFRGKKTHPAILALNYLKADAWELGNHEFNYEFESLQKNIKGFKGTVLGANIYKADGTRFVNPYLIKNVKGVKVAIIGIEAPHVTNWESDPSHYNGMKFTTPEEEIGKVLGELEKEKPDVIVALCHYGEEGEYELAKNGGMYDVAKKYADKIDAFLIGHSHTTLTDYLVNGEWKTEYTEGASTVLLETNTQGINVGKLTITVEKDGTGWKVTDKKVENLSTAGKAADKGLVKVLKTTHKKSVKKANTVVGTIAEDFHETSMFVPGMPYELIADGPVLDLIHTVQLKETGADISLAALFDVNSNLKKGDYKLKDGVNVYKYDNTLMAVKITGKQLKAIMEQQHGAFYNEYKDGDVTISFNENIRMYNCDTFQGKDGALTYEIDISKAVGKRIKNLKWKGEKIKDDDKFVLALNNYRYSGLVGAGLLNADDLVYDSNATASIPAVRDMISQYVKSVGKLTPKCDNNWKIVGYNFKYDGVDVEAIYQMIRDGKIVIPASSDGRTTNVKAVNIKDLKAQGLIK